MKMDKLLCLHATAAESAVSIQMTRHLTHVLRVIPTLTPTSQDHIYSAAEVRMALGRSECFGESSMPILIKLSGCL